MMYNCDRRFQRREQEQRVMLKEGLSKRRLKLPEEERGGGGGEGRSEGGRVRDEPG